MKTIKITFKNHPTPDGKLETFSINDCLVANNGTPTAARPQILIHLPATSNKAVDGAFVAWGGHEWHVVGTTVAQMDGNTPTKWNRYAIAERIRAL